MNFTKILAGACFVSGCTAGSDTGTHTDADSAAVHQYIEQAYAMYGEPNSPARDEDLYIEALRKALADPGLSATDSVRAAHYLQMALKNRPGQQAVDFRYETLSGVTCYMHGIEAQRLLVAFYDPECPHCSDILRMLDTPEVNTRIADGALTVLAVYTEGNDSVWRASASDMPKQWIVAADRDSIVDRDIYDIPAMPIFYLLDSEKRVLLKDAPVDVIMQNL